MIKIHAAILGLLGAAMADSITPEPLCLEDSQSNRILPTKLFTSGSLTYASCEAGCKANNYLFFGVQYSQECFCGNDYEKIRTAAVRPVAECQHMCKGDTTKPCGGNNRIQVGAVKWDTSANTYTWGNQATNTDICLETGPEQTYNQIAWTEKRMPSYYRDRDWCSDYCKVRDYAYFTIRADIDTLWQCGCTNDFDQIRKFPAVDSATNCNVSCDSNTGTCGGDGFHVLIGNTDRYGPILHDSILYPGDKQFDDKTSNLLDSFPADITGAVKDASAMTGRPGICLKYIWSPSFPEGQWGPIFVDENGDDAEVVFTVNDFAVDPAISFGLIDQDTCATKCAHAGYKFFSVGQSYGGVDDEDNTICTCGNKMRNAPNYNLIGDAENDYDDQIWQAKFCDFPCPGNRKQRCGGIGQLRNIGYAEVSPKVSANTWTSMPVDDVVDMANVGGPVQLCVDDNANGIDTFGNGIKISTAELPTAELDQFSCKNACAARRYEIWGVTKGSECWCTNDWTEALAGRFLDSSNYLGDCSNSCPANPQEECGNTYRFNMGYTMIPKPPPPGTYDGCLPGYPGQNNSAGSHNSGDNPSNKWMDSVKMSDGKCYCDTNGFDHGAGDFFAVDPISKLAVTLKRVCDAIGSPASGLTRIAEYNDVQCGNGPENWAGDEAPDRCNGLVVNIADTPGIPLCRSTGPYYDYTNVNLSPVGAAIAGHVGLGYDFRATPAPIGSKFRLKRVDHDLYSIASEWNTYLDIASGIKQVADDSLESSHFEAKKAGAHNYNSWIRWFINVDSNGNRQRLMKSGNSIALTSTIYDEFEKNEYADPTGEEFYMHDLGSGYYNIIVGPTTTYFEYGKQQQNGVDLVYRMYSYVSGGSFLTAL